MRSGRLSALAQRFPTVSRIEDGRGRLGGLAAVISVLALLSLVSACGNPRLSYGFVDDDRRDYTLSMTVAEKGPNGETWGTVKLEALLRVEVQIDERNRCGNLATVDYEDTKISTTGSARSTESQVPRAYFSLLQDRLLTLNGPAPRGDDYSVEIARTGRNGSLSAMLLNTFVGHCFAQPQRDARHELKLGNAWTTIRQLPGEFVTYVYTGTRPTGDQNRETTHVKVTGLTGGGALAELAWSSVTPLQGSRELDLTESYVESGMSRSEIADFGLDDLKATVAIYGSSTCSGTAFIRTADGWPQQASVHRMIIDLTYAWSQAERAGSPSAAEGRPWPTAWRLVPSYPDDLLASIEAGPVELILEITGSIEAAP